MSYTKSALLVCLSATLVACGGNKSDKNAKASPECKAAGDAEARVMKAEMGDSVSASDLAEVRSERIGKCTKAKYNKTMIACLKAAKSIENLANCDLDEKDRKSTPKASPDCEAIADVETRLTVKEMGGKIAQTGLRKDAIVKCMKANYSAQAIKCLKAATNMIAIANCQVDEKERRKKK